MPALASVAAAAAAAACSSTAYAPPAAPLWSINAVATLEPGGGYTVHTVTLAPEDCFAASEATASRSSLPGTIELRITLTRADGSCRHRATDIEHDFEAPAAAAADTQVEVIVIADGEEKSRSIVPLSPPRQLDRI